MQILIGRVITTKKKQKTTYLQAQQTHHSGSLPVNEPPPPGTPGEMGLAAATSSHERAAHFASWRPAVDKWPSQTFMTNSMSTSFTFCWGISRIRLMVVVRSGWKQLPATAATPNNPLCSLKKHGAGVFAQVLGPSCLVGILSVPGSSPGDAFATPISSAPRLELSSRCLRCPEDVTWPTPEKFLPFLFSKTAIVFYYRCLKIALLSCHGSVFFFPTPPPPSPLHPSLLQTATSLSNKMSPHKMKSKRLRVYQTSYQALGVEPGSHRKLLTTITLLHALSAPISCLYLS